MVLTLAAVLLFVQDRPSPDWLPVLDAPRNLGHTLTIAPPRASGARLELRGRVLKSDGRTPFPGVIVYFHHTDGNGIYPRPAGARPTDWTYWHGSLRGWLKTDSEGRYVLKTTRPAPYPNDRMPAHIHAYGVVPGTRAGFMFDDIVFAGDPFLTKRDRNVVRLVRDEKGILQGRIDLVMPR